MQFQSNPFLFLYLIALFYVSASVTHDPYYIVALYFCSAWIAKETISRVVQDCRDFTLLTWSHANYLNTQNTEIITTKLRYFLSLWSRVQERGKVSMQSWQNTQGWCVSLHTVVCKWILWRKHKYENICSLWRKASLRTLLRKAAQYWEQQERGELQSIEKTQVCTHGQYSMEKTQVCTHGHPPLVCGCNELIRKGRSSTRKHCPAKPTVLGTHFYPTYLSKSLLLVRGLTGKHSWAIPTFFDILPFSPIFIQLIEALPSYAQFPWHYYSVLPFFAILLTY